jgi:hypothetical protein
MKVAEAVRQACIAIKGAPREAAPRGQGEWTSGDEGRSTAVGEMTKLVVPPTFALPRVRAFGAPGGGDRAARRGQMGDPETQRSRP